MRIFQRNFSQQISVALKESWRPVRRGIGFVPQGREIFARLTVEENLRFAAAIRSTFSQYIPRSAWNRTLLSFWARSKSGFARSSW